MKAKKMIVPILMGALMAFAILPMTAGKAYAEDYELYVGGTPVTSDNASDILGDRTAGYDAESKTLTLNGVTIPEDNTTGILSKIPDLKIEVHGENKLSGQDIGIYSPLQNLTITGEGSLEAEGLRYGIYSYGDITITDATVSATGTGNDSIGIEATGEIKIEGRSKVQAKGSYYAIVCDSGITLGGGHAITEPVNGRISDDGYYIVDQAGQKATSVTIERAVKMSGDGTEESPYQIKTYADLKEFASIVNGKHQAPQNTAACGKLMDNITCDDKKWTPIGNENSPFIGHFDGDNHIIKGLSNEETGAGNYCQGLFGFIGKQDDTVKGEVKNVGLEGGKIIGFIDVGGVVGYNIGGEITNCYNTGEVSGGGSYVGGVAGDLFRGEITNCYNTGAVSGNKRVGGVVGDNSGTITNCYNAGAVSGSDDVGGVAGTNGGAIKNCYYNKELNVVKAIGDGSAGTNVEGLETSQMVGTAALNYMAFSYESPSENPWLTKEAGKDADSRTYYEYYPHLKGFAYDSTKSAEDWPAKLTTSVDWRDVEASYPYNGSPQGPTVTKVTMSQKPVKVPSGMTGEWRSKTVDESSGDPMWSDPPVYDEPNTSGAYWLKIKDGDKVIEEMVYVILRKEANGKLNDYTVRYQVQKKIAGGGTEWSDFGSSKPVDGGKYKEVVTLAGGTVLDEKVFRIVRPLTITTVPTASAITYGHKLNDSKLTGGVAKDGDAEVAGTFTWDEPDTIPAVSDSDLTEYDVTFTPDDTVIYDPQPMKVTVPVNKAKLTITAISYSLSYNGEMQGPGDKTYNDAAEIAEVVKVEGLQGSDALTSVEVDGQGKEVGEYVLRPNDAAVGTATDNYDITYVNGTLTITKAKPKPTPPQPKPDPKPQPKVNKAAAKTSLDAGVIAKSSGSKVTASWGAVKGASSYVIYANYCDQKKCKKIKTVSGKTTSFNITKLNGKKFNPKKNLKFYVVAYQKVNGKNVKLSKSIMAHAPGSKNSKRTNVIGVKVKKASFTLKKGKTAKIKAKLVLQKKSKKPLKHCAKFRYASSNKKVAKVSKKGKITAIGKGKCTVYVYAVSGVSKKIKVTVK